MNNFLFRSGNDVDKDNYFVIYLLILFLVFKVSYTSIFSFINGTNNLYLIFKPIIFYLFYYFILYTFNRKNDSYYIILSLIIAFIVSSNVSLLLFFIFSIIGNSIGYLFKNKVNSVIITCLFLSIYLGNIIDSYNGIFYYGYLVLCGISYVYLYFNKLFKYTSFIYSFIGIFIINIIKGNFIIDISLFCLLFIVSDNRFSAFTRKSQILSSILFSMLIFMFNYIFSLDCYLFLSILLYEIVSFIINYFSIKICDNKFFNFLFVN